jgi:hypothetical protein
MLVRVISGLTSLFFKICTTVIVALARRSSDMLAASDAATNILLIRALLTFASSNHKAKYPHEIALRHANSGFASIFLQLAVFDMD